MKTEKLKGKDLINIGIYSAIYAVLICVIAMLGYIPVFMPLLAVIGPIIGGIPFMLFLTKVKKFGMIWFMGAIMGLVMLLTGMGWYSLAVNVVTGLIAELIYKSGNYKSLKEEFSLTVFSASGSGGTSFLCLRILKAISPQGRISARSISTP